MKTYILQSILFSALLTGCEFVERCLAPKSHDSCLCSTNCGGAGDPNNGTENPSVEEPNTVEPNSQRFNLRQVENALDFDISECVLVNSRNITLYDVESCGCWCFDSTATLRTESPEHFCYES